MKKIIKNVILCVILCPWLFLLLGLLGFVDSVTVNNFVSLFSEKVFIFIIPTTIILSAIYFLYNLIRFILSRIKKDKDIASKYLKNFLWGIAIFLSVVLTWWLVAVLQVTCCGTSDLGPGPIMPTIQ